MTTLMHPNDSRDTNQPLVSVGIPVYNGESFIGDAIESVLAQRYANVEIVICDNCSTDQTREVCSTYASRSDRIRYHRCATHTDSAINFFRVLNLARGKFFMWACADDIRPPGSIESLMAAMLRSPQAVMVHGPILAKAIQSTRLIANRMHLMSNDPRERIRAFVQGFYHNGMIFGLYRTDILRRARFKLHYGRDYHLCLQMCLFGPIEYSAEPMIILNERTLHPVHDAMGSARKLTLGSVLRGGRTDRKVWVTLLYGCWYLLTTRQVTLSKRLGCVFVFGPAFIGRYPGRLMRDAILIGSNVLGWPLLRGWALARHWTTLFAAGRRVKQRIVDFAYGDQGPGKHAG